MAVLNQEPIYLEKESDIKVDQRVEYIWDFVQPTPSTNTDTAGYIFHEDDILIVRHLQPLTYIKEFCEISDNVSGDTDNLIFQKQWRWSIDNVIFSEWLEFDQMPTEWNWLDDLFVEFKYIALKNPDDSLENPDAPEEPYLMLNNIKLDVIREFERTDQKVTLTEPNQCTILAPDDKWKVFKLIGFDVTAGGITDSRQLDIQFRASFTSGRMWTPWMPMTNENLQGLDLDPLRFWFLEIQFCRLGEDNTGDIKIYDIELYGDFQNVTHNYQTTARLGLREDCRSKYAGPGDAEDCDPTETPYPPPEWETECDTGELWNPYDTGSLPLYEKLTNDVNQLFGWPTVYYKTDPDNQGRDVILHEYSLQHVIAEADIKIMVDKNQFPDNKVTFTPFDLEMFETFVVHITREEFKKAFGVEERPRKWDMLFLCETNRLYQVEHAQAHKDFLNSSVYYEVSLKKAQNNLNVKPATPEIEESIKELTENSSLDSLFKEETLQETETISDKPQLNVLTRDEIRKEINGYVRNIEMPIENGPNIISKNYYDLSNVATDIAALTYTKADKQAVESDNRSFIFWFNLKTKKPGVAYNLITNQSIINGMPEGYRFTYMDGRIDVEWNDQMFEFMIPGLQTDHWYAIVANVDQVKRNIRLMAYRRKSDKAPRSYRDPE